MNAHREPAEEANKSLVRWIAIMLRSLRMRGMPHTHAALYAHLVEGGWTGSLPQLQRMSAGHPLRYATLKQRYQELQRAWANSSAAPPWLREYETPDDPRLMRLMIERLKEELADCARAADRHLAELSDETLAPWALAIVKRNV